MAQLSVFCCWLGSSRIQKFCLCPSLFHHSCEESGHHYPHCSLLPPLRLYNADGKRPQRCSIGKHKNQNPRNKNFYFIDFEERRKEISADSFTA